jgi:hypothetical protein
MNKQRKRTEKSWKQETHLYQHMSSRREAVRGGVLSPETVGRYLESEVIEFGY